MIDKNLLNQYLAARNAEQTTDFETLSREIQERIKSYHEMITRLEICINNYYVLNQTTHNIKDKAWMYLCNQAISHEVAWHYLCDPGEYSRGIYCVMQYGVIFGGQVNSQVFPEIKCDINTPQELLFKYMNTIKEGFSLNNYVDLKYQRNLVLHKSAIDLSGLFYPYKYLSFNRYNFDCFLCDYLNNINNIINYLRYIERLYNEFYYLLLIFSARYPITISIKKNINDIITLINSLISIDIYQDDTYSDKEGKGTRAVLGKDKLALSLFSDLQFRNLINGVPCEEGWQLRKERLQCIQNHTHVLRPIIENIIKIINDLQALLNNKTDLSAWRNLAGSGYVKNYERKISLKPNICSGQCSANNIRDIVFIQEGTPSNNVEQIAQQIRSEIWNRVRVLQGALDQLFIYKAQKFTK